MGDIQEMRNRAKSAFDDKDYQLSAELHADLWESVVPQNKWDGWHLARSLRKLGQVAQALEICKQVREIDSSNDLFSNVYGWCLYDLHIKLPDEQIQANEESFFDAAEAIVSLCKPDQYSPYERTVFQVLRYLKPRKKRRTISQKILDWTDKLAVDQLSTEQDTYGREGEGEDNASPREKWYSIRTAALFELGDYEQCIKLCQEALTSFERLHYGNQHWFRMRIANSHGHLGQIEQAIHELQEVARAKPEWFIFQDIAEWQYRSENYSDAFVSALQAAQNHRNNDKLENKWELFLLMGQILQKQGQIEHAQQHVRLAYLLRVEQQWDIPAVLSGAMHDLGVEQDADETSQDAFRNLRSVWEEYAPYFHGIIKTLRTEKGFGFVRSDDGTDHYFKFRDFKDNRAKLAEGLRVRFHVVGSFDPVKGCSSTAAVDISIAR